jgi:hypothetical protein
MVLLVVVPLARSYRDGSVCPYALICSTGRVEIALLFTAKTPALLMYAPLAVIVISKCDALCSYIYST